MLDKKGIYNVIAAIKGISGMDSCRSWSELDDVIEQTLYSVGVARRLLERISPLIVSPISRSALRIVFPNVILYQRRSNYIHGLAQVS